MVEIASPLALPGIAERVIAAAAAAQGHAAAVHALLAEVMALRDRGDYIAMIGRVADLDGLRRELTDAVGVFGTQQAALIAALADARQERDWQAAQEARAVQARPRLSIAAGG